MLSEGESYAHAAGGNVRYSCATNAGADANLFQYPVTLGSLADLSSDSEVEIIEAIGMHILKILLFVKSRVSHYMTVHTRSRGLLAYRWTKLTDKSLSVPFFCFDAMPSCRNSYLTQEAKKQDEFRRLATRRAWEGLQENTVSRRIHERSTRPEAGLTRVKSSGEEKTNVAKIFKPHYLWPLCYCWPGILLLCLQS